MKNEDAVGVVRVRERVSGSAVDVEQPWRPRTDVDDAVTAVECKGHVADCFVELDREAAEMVDKFDFPVEFVNFVSRAGELPL